MNLFFKFAWLLFFLFWTFCSTNVLAQTTLINDGVVSGSISAPGEFDEFTFDASAGDAVHIRAAYTSGSQRIEAWLYSPDGTLIRYYPYNDTAEFDCYVSSSNCQINQAGIYRLVVADYGSDDTGNYDIHFAKECARNNILKQPSLNNEISPPLSAPDGMIVSRRRREICQSEVRDSARGRLKFYPE